MNVTICERGCGRTSLDPGTFLVIATILIAPLVIMGGLLWLMMPR